MAHWCKASSTWWRHQMEAFSALLALCAGNSPVTGEFPAQRSVTRSFDVFFDLRLNKGWINNVEAGDLRRHRTHYDVTVMLTKPSAELGIDAYSRLSIALTHWGRVRLDAISQTTFSSAFYWMEMYELRLKIHWSLFLRVQLTLFQHWFR